MHIDEVKYTNYWKATVAQVVEWVGLCLEGRWSDPPPGQLHHGRCVLGQDTSPTSSDCV